MTPRWKAVTLGLLLAFCGCRLVAVLVAIPVVLLNRIAAAFTWVLVGDGSLASDDELTASGIRIEHRSVDFELADDMTFTGTLEETKVVTSPSGLDDAQHESISFMPDTEELELEEAHVELPDGTIVPVEDRHVFTRPSAAAADAPEFVESSTTTVIYPQLRVGSKIHSRWRFRERGRSIFGFNYSWRPALTYPVAESIIRIRHPAGVALRHAVRGGFAVTESSDGGQHVVTATLREFAGLTAERWMVAPRDVCPLFVATTVASWEEIGARFHEAVTSGIEVTPEIQALADRIADGRSGLEAAQALYRWTCSNIRYVKVYLQQMDGWIPHRANEVLQRGFGDCKDQYVLLASLLRARGIDAEPVLVDLERAFEPLPLATPLQFNHCMAYLPQFDLFANPTDPWRDLGILDVAVSGKFVVVASKTGRTSRTPPGDPDRNRVVTTHRIEVTDDGRIAGTSAIESFGRPAGRARRFLVEAGTAERAADDLLFDGSQLASGSLRSTDPTDLSRPLRCDGEWQGDVKLPMADRLCFQIPNGLDFVTPLQLRNCFSATERRFPLVVSAIELVSSRTITLPTAWTFTAPPAGRELRNHAASYTTSARLVAPNVLQLERRLRLEKDVYSPADCKELGTILEAVAEDMQAIALAERTEAGKAAPR